MRNNTPPSSSSSKRISSFCESTMIMCVTHNIYVSGAFNFKCDIMINTIEDEIQL